MAKLMTFHFLKPGLQTLVQDAGRPGFQQFGVPVSGALDKSSARIANWLVGNPAEAPVLEITYSGPQIGIEGDCQVALAGADLSPMVDGSPVPMYETLDLLSGSMLTFGRLKTGCRAYLAVRGEWQVKKWLSSYSALPFGSPEATPQSLIGKGSVLEILAPAPVPKKIFPIGARPDYGTGLRARVLPGPEFEAFSRIAIASFFGKTWRLSADCNRMGYRLEGRLPDFSPEKEIISSGIVPGTVQVTHSGQPVILLADAQTTGGYPRIANVVTADLDALAQLKPGDEVGFLLVKLEEAYGALKLSNEYLPHF